MELIRFLGFGDGETDNAGLLHLNGANGADYTLCGITLDDDPETAGPSEIVTAAAVTCPDCIAIIKHCRGVRIQRLKNED